ncbi:ferric-dicitrate binding protein FerR (iron transport regulator) [Pedobacter cryoconitis]|uniref:Ferric-dicitrate binding protein FerR (Iron transport regulator) n=1 Tax=Pedobacter cryoconitis TaxID=188932 RepID=A0A7W8YTF7_9SPHI|nr:FecR domain-containing protein [Pedobacter cryoconitis]MBB5621283.1 ferric-dicitrate binding protein FerR (iron transport regulator) [Pedobacter cryoconitis]
MNMSDELLNKYFKGTCTPEEKILVTQYLNETDDLPASIFSKEEWDETPDATISEEETSQMFQAIKKQTIAKVRPVSWLKITAAAAIVLTVLGIGLLSLNRNQPKPGLANQENLHAEVKTVVNWKSVVNYTEQDQLLTLPDNSTVKIYPGGELRYTVPFVQHNREIYLKGKGFFEVTKDTKHPFIVYAKGVSTTALGTSFTITALEKNKLVKVQLHTGKVWVKNVDSTNHIKPFSEILKPGDELVYNTLLNKVKLMDAKLPLSKQKDSPAILNFTQAPLADVFASLEQHYQVKIIYNPADVAEMSFTGSLKLTQPIVTILEEITELNKLSQTKTTKGYLISK